MYVEAAGAIPGVRLDPNIGPGGAVTGLDGISVKLLPGQYFIGLTVLPPQQARFDAKLKEIREREARNPQKPPAQRP
jgi:hypothetical protein